LPNQFASFLPRGARNSFRHLALARSVSKSIEPLSTRTPRQVSKLASCRYARVLVPGLVFLSQGRVRSIAAAVGSARRQKTQCPGKGSKFGRQKPNCQKASDNGLQHPLAVRLPPTSPPVPGLNPTQDYRVNIDILSAIPANSPSVTLMVMGVFRRFRAKKSMSPNVPPGGQTDARRSKSHLRIWTFPIAKDL